MKRILLVEDNETNCDMLLRRLRRLGYEVSGADNGVSGLAAARSHAPDVILMDLSLPEMDGWEVYKQMRADEVLKNIPVIILTARNSSFEEIIARERVGVNDYVTKPFVPNDLRNSLARILGPAPSQNNA